jgi:hypothetical protein
MTPEEYKNFGKYNPNLSNSEMIKNRYADTDKFQSWLREQFRAAKSLPAEITASEIPDFDWRKVKVPEDAKARFDEIIKAQGGIKPQVEYNLAKAVPTLEQLTSKATGLGTLKKIAQGAGKLAGKALPYLPYASGVGAAFTALDLGQALSEVQDKGAAKIAEDYRREQEKTLAESEDTGDRVFEKARMMDKMERAAMQRERLASGARRDYQSSKYSGNPSMKNESTEYSPEERAKLKDMLSKYRAEPTLR